MNDLRDEYGVSRGASEGLGVWKALKGEGWKYELKQILSFAGTGLLLGGMVCLVLYLMQSPMPGNKAASGVMVACLIGGSSLFFGLLLFLPVGASLLDGKFPSLSEILMPIVYYAAFLALLVNVPRWDKVVVNVRDGYHDFQKIHEGEPREHHYRMAESLAETTRPIWEWLARSEE